MDGAAGHDVCGDQLDQRAEQPRDVAQPFGELAAIDIKAAAGVDLGLPVERDMIAEFGDGDVGEEACVHHAARDRQVGHRRLHHGLALPARAGGPHVAFHLEVAGHIDQHLSDASADFAQLGTAELLANAGRHVDDVAARELERQLAALLLLGLNRVGRL